MRRLLRLALVVLLVVAAGMTALAQRGGFRNRQTYASNMPYDGRFVFVRMSYPWNGRGGAYWAHDYPDGERNLLKTMNAITNLPIQMVGTSIMSYSDPDIFKNPVIYQAEPGYWYMTDDEVKNLRSYLLKGGFLILDDFPAWGWDNTALQLSRVFPDLHWVDLEPSHPIFHSFFDIDSFDIVPQFYMQGRPIFRGLFEGNNKDKRMYVVANYNTDISEYWEHAAGGFKPVSENNEAFKIAINQFVYGITH
jgi:Domain of unknown function (DUF4159)